MDYKFTISLIEKYIQNYVAKNNSKGVVLGISGGLDSAVVAFLCQRALGHQKVYGLVMPYKTSAESSINDANLVVNSLAIKAETIDISPQIEAYFYNFGGLESVHRLRVGNKVARERMSVLYDFAKNYDLLVAGTSNKTELLLGYFTLWGDMAAAFEPIGDLYKTQVGRLAAELGVPESIIAKEPSADLWPGQTDEGEIGFSYAELDAVLYRFCELNMTAEAIVAAGISRQTVQSIIGMVQRSAFKRRLPHILHLQHLLVCK